MCGMKYIISYLFWDIDHKNILSRQDFEKIKFKRAKNDNFSIYLCMLSLEN